MNLVIYNNIMEKIAIYTYISVNLSICLNLMAGMKNDI